MSRSPIQSTPPPARIHLLPAKEAPAVVVIRRKPSRVFHILRWNTETDEVESGSWFSGRLYDMRSDVSFDGEWMTYLAMGANGQTWTGICRPPYLRTAVHWENHGSWHGGGVFSRHDLLHANPGYSREEMAAALRANEVALPFRVEEIPSHYHGEDEGVLYPRFERDGFRRVGPLGEESQIEGEGLVYLCKDDPGWVCQPTPAHPVLRIRYRGYRSGQGRVFEFDLPDYPDLLHPTVSWAAYDALGQLVFARLGVLYRYTPDGIQNGTGPAAMIDLEPLAKGEPEDGSVKKAKRHEWEVRPEDPPIRIVEGALEEQPVWALIVPTAQVDWAVRIRELAGDFLTRQLAEERPADPVYVTPGYYLRQHDLVHVEEPSPNEGFEALERTCTLAFDAAAAHTGKGVALRPIGTASGWPIREAARATFAAAACYAAEEEGRQVLVVAEGAEQRTVLEEMLASAS